MREDSVVVVVVVIDGEREIRRTEGKQVVDR